MQNAHNQHTHTHRSSGSSYEQLALWVVKQRHEHATRRLVDMQYVTCTMSYVLRHMFSVWHVICNMQYVICLVCDM